VRLLLPLFLLLAIPARAETVRFAAGESVVLVGRVDGPARGDAVVLLHGSERGTRDNAYFRAVRERLVGEGWIVLTYDRRGAGESGGTWVETPNLAVPARDAAAAVHFLHARSGVRRVGLIGISQGGWAAPLAATLEPGVAFVVAVSEPGVTPIAQSAFQRSQEWLEAGIPASDVAKASALRLLLFSYWHGDATRAAIDSAWAEAHAHAWFARASADDDLFRRLAASQRVPPVTALPDEFRAAIRDHFFHDPRPVAMRLPVPILHLYGAGDRHLPVAESIAAFTEAYARAGKRDATFVTLPHAGHGMQKLDGERECFDCPHDAWVPADGFLDTLATWLGKRRTP
jgi:pimeloyl-ACP methyl ester carboxylesterase